MPDIEQQAMLFQQDIDQGRENYPDLVYPGGYYKTIVSGAIQAFGWDMLLTAVGVDSKKFGEDVLEGIFKITQANINAWAKTDIDCFISHDNMVSTQGAIFRPQFYREYIFPRFKELWKPLKDKGIKVIFCSDGGFTEFIDDIAQAGADGFIFETNDQPRTCAQDTGKTHTS